jgi:4-hydroxymandelate oxidase
MNLTDCINLADLEIRGRTQLARMVADYFAGGAGDEQTLRANRAAFAAVHLRPRVLVDVEQRSAQTTLLGTTVRWPVLAAPVGLQRLAHPEGELASAQAASATGTLYVASTMSNYSLEAIAAASPGPKWFQLYVFRDRGLTRSLVERAEAAGYLALQVTADAPILGVREADVRNGFHLPDGVRLANLESAGLGAMPAHAHASGANRFTAQWFDTRLTWHDLDWLRSFTRLPVLVKGVLRGDDAVRALDHGAAGVVVSNHGGRQLDTAPATFAVLPEIGAALAGRGLIVLDGGVRRGTDVLKALAAGAQAVQIGRPIVWGLAAGGSAGVQRALELLHAEVDNALALTGCPTLATVTPDLLS